MIEKKILIVEDSRSTRTLLAKVLDQKGYSVVTAANGQEGLEKLKEQGFPLVLTDLEMPVMNGHEFIRACNAQDDTPVILVLTSHGDTDTIIAIMKEGVFDYVIKPIRADDLLMRIERAISVAEFKKTQKIIEKEKTIRLEQQLEWYRWEDRGKAREKIFSSQTLFSNLRTSFNQGAGMGLLISLLNIIAETAVQNEQGGWIVDDELFAILKKNLKIAEGVIDSFAELDHIITDTVKMDSVETGEVYSLIKSSIREVESLSGVKKQNLMLNDFRPPANGARIAINRDFLPKAFREIFINAMKFSEPMSNIVTMVTVHDKSVEISVMNVPIRLPNGITGIPIEYENIIFEPFYRIGREVYEAYGSNDYGLGLTFVEKIVNRHGGKVFLHNITDHTNLKMGPLTKVICTVQIPLQ